MKKWENLFCVAGWIRSAYSDKIIYKEDEVIRKKLKRFISNCMEAVGGSLKDFTSLKAITEYKITTKLANYLIDLSSSCITDNGQIIYPNKKNIFDWIDSCRFDNKSPVDDYLNVAAEFINANFTDEVYHEVKERIKQILSRLETERINWLKAEYKSKRGRTSFTNGFINFIGSLTYDTQKREEYFQYVWRYYQSFDKSFDKGYENAFTKREKVLVEYLKLYKDLKMFIKMIEDEV